MKKSILVSLVASMALSTASFAEEAKADESKFNMSSNVAITSNYIWRGASQTKNKPAAQAGIDFNNVGNLNGLTIGVWGSGSDSTNGSEIDLYIDYSANVSEIASLDVGYINYLYTGSYTSTGSASYGEVYLGTTIAENYGLMVYVEDGQQKTNNVTLEASASVAMVDLVAGNYFDLDATETINSSYFYASAGVNWDCLLDDSYGMNFTVAYNSSDGVNAKFYGIDSSGVTAALTMSKEF